MKSTLRIKNLIKYWLPVVLWALLIFGFSSKPTGTVGDSYAIDVFIKKMAHIVEYFVLMLLLYRALFWNWKKKEKSLKLALVLCVLYAFSDEFHQSFTPTREPHIRDVMFDTIGAGLAYFLIWKLLPKIPKPLRKLAESLGLE